MKFATCRGLPGGTPGDPGRRPSRWRGACNLKVGALGRGPQHRCTRNVYLVERLGESVGHHDECGEVEAESAWLP